MVGSRQTGNETYVVNLSQALAQLPDVKCGAAGVLTSASSGRFANVEPVALRGSGNWFRLLYALPAACRDWKADVLHVTYVSPFLVPCPVVATVHDVSFKRYPEFFSPRDRLLFATLLPLTLRRVSAVITLSRHARQEILDVFPYLNGKVHVTHLAPSPLFRPGAEKELLQRVRSRYRIASEFVLAVGNLQPRKNLVRLINAFASVRRRIGPIQLVIVGKAHWQSSVVHTTVRRFGLEHDVVFTGYVPDADLALLYSAAGVFVYPSVYEGFGLPVLEAMACGTPVVASNTSAIPEVAGDAALLVDPYQEEQIADALELVLTNHDVTRSLSAMGLIRAQQFSWRRTAQEALSVYQTVLEQFEDRKALP